MGMWGGDDPEPRKPLWWQDIAFQDEMATNIQPGAKRYDKVGFNQQQFDWYKKLIAIRKANPVLMHGDMEFFLTEGQRLGYKRSDGKDEVLVLFNLEGTECTFALPVAGKYTNLLDGGKIDGKSVKVKPLGAVVLKRD
jgi:glycosidase